MSYCSWWINEQELLSYWTKHNKILKKFFTLLHFSIWGNSILDALVNFTVFIIRVSFHLEYILKEIFSFIVDIYVGLIKLQPINTVNSCCFFKRNRCFCPKMTKTLQNCHVQFWVNISVDICNTLAVNKFRTSEDDDNEIFLPKI